jgi:hypothetical protein
VNDGESVLKLRNQTGIPVWTGTGMGKMRRMERRSKRCIQITFFIIPLHKCCKIIVQNKRNWIPVFSGMTNPYRSNYLE